MNDASFYMDIDGPEFLKEVNNEINQYREQVPMAGPNAALETFYNQQNQNNNNTVFECHQIVVLDTNFLISNLGFLTALSAQAEKYLGSLVIMVPWVVVRELDGLKDRSKIQTNQHGASGKLGELARKAMRFIQIALTDKRGWLRGQKMSEVFDQDGHGVTKGDDSILDCCRYFSRLGKPITLLTNDRNLAIKAMIHEIQVLSAENRSQLIDFATHLSKYKSAAHPDLTYQQQQQQQHHHPHHHQLPTQQPTTGYIDEDVEMMDESDTIDVVRQQLQEAQAILETTQEQQTIRASLTNPNNDQSFTVWASKHAPGGTNTSLSPHESLFGFSKSNTRYSSLKKQQFNTVDLWDDAPVLDQHGEPLIPPSSSAGRVEELQRKKKQSSSTRRY